MSRFKLFGIFQAMMAAIMLDGSLNDSQRIKKASAINRQSGGIMFTGNPYGPRQKNQRQKRKRLRQNPHLRNA